MKYSKLLPESKRKEAWGEYVCFHKELTFELYCMLVFEYLIKSQLPQTFDPTVDNYFHVKIYTK